MENDGNIILYGVLESLSDLVNKHGEWKQILETEENVSMDFENLIVNLKYEYECLYDDLIKYRSLYEQLDKENMKMVNCIVDAYNNEKTMMGKSVLKQLMERLEWDIKWE